MPAMVVATRSAAQACEPRTRAAVVGLALCASALALLGACDRHGDAASPPALPSASASASPSASRLADVDGVSAPSETLDRGLNDANRALRSGQFADVEKLVADYLARSGAAAHKGQAEFMLGLSFHRRQLYEAARGHFARAVELEPDYVPTYYFYGFALFNLGRFDDAERAFATYLKAKPDKADAIFGRGLVALEQDRIDDAQRYISRAIEIVDEQRAHGKDDAEAKKDSARYHARLADVYLRRDDLVHARAALETSVKLWPDFFESWNKLYEVLSRLGENDAAQAALAKYKETLARRTKLGGPR
jgi:tetratricopeptide (TPR) repeat protein